MSKLLAIVPDRSKDNILETIPYTITKLIEGYINSAQTNSYISHDTKQQIIILTGGVCSYLLKHVNSKMTQKLKIFVSL